MEMKTDFEKLVVARKYVTALERENKLLKKEVVTQFKAAKAAEKALEKARKIKKKMSSAEKRKIKSDIYVQQLEETINDLQAKLEVATKVNNERISQLIRMKAESRNHQLPGCLMTKLKSLFQKLKKRTLI